MVSYWGTIPVSIQIAKGAEQDTERAGHDRPGLETTIWKNIMAFFFFFFFFVFGGHNQSKCRRTVGNHPANGQGAFIHIYIYIYIYI